MLVYIEGFPLQFSSVILLWIKQLKPAEIIITHLTRFLTWTWKSSLYQITASSLISHELNRANSIYNTLLFELKAFSISDILLTANKLKIVDIEPAGNSCQFISNWEDRSTSSHKYSDSVSETLVELVTICILQTILSPVQWICHGN